MLAISVDQLILLVVSYKDTTILFYFDMGLSENVPQVRSTFDCCVCNEFNISCARQSTVYVGRMPPALSDLPTALAYSNFFSPARIGTRSLFSAGVIGHAHSSL